MRAPGRPSAEIMENRKQAILRAVVHEFTTSAVPVGSQALQSRYFVNLSSATIRSELAELADLGYLAQPHTSSGRVPTDSGYRYFVDFLMDLEKVPERVDSFIKEELRQAPSDVQGMVEKVAMTVAAVTQNASVASAPQGSQARIKHIDLVSLEPTEVLLILLLEGNLLRQQVVTVAKAANQSDLTKLALRLNTTLGGRASDEVRGRYDAAVLGLEKELLGRVVAVLDLYEKGSESLVVHDGVRNLLRQPEFAESSRLQQVLEVLEETRYLTVLLRQLIGESDLQIVIGSENASSQLQGCAVVLTTYGPSNRLKGVLGVIGPTRMEYSQTVARLQAVARSASDRMAELGV
jgi:heat-inducible transcriptional repressor